MAAGNADRLARADNTRPDHFAFIDGLAQIDIGIAGRAEITHRGEAGFKRGLGIRDTANRGPRGRNREADADRACQPGWSGGHGCR